jgi:uncharacterized protein YciI
MLLLAVSTQGHIVQLPTCSVGFGAAKCHVLASRDGRALGVAPQCSARHRLAPLQMMARKKAVVEEDDDDDYIVQEEDENERIKMVDAMSTSLGYEEELKPFPGPNVAEEEGDLDEPRALFCHFAPFPSNQMPSEGLQAAYSAWLQQRDVPGDVSLVGPHYLLAAETFDEEAFWAGGGGGVLSDDDIARLDAQEEAAAAAAAATATATLDPDADPDSEATDNFANAEAPAALEMPSEMEAVDLQFVQGHLTLARAPSWEVARSWVASDPVSLAGGASAPQLHQWIVSDEEELRVTPTGESLQTYVVHCLDHAGSGALRASTREKHLEWLRASGRVYMGGPLLNDEGVDGMALGAGERVGTLLLVGGDDLDEVQNWARSDPYAGAGLFSSVTVAPLHTYDVNLKLAQ